MLAQPMVKKKKKNTSHDNNVEDVMDGCIFYNILAVGKLRARLYGLEWNAEGDVAKQKHGAERIAPHSVSG